MSAVPGRAGGPSQAYEKFIDDPDDLEGLVGYAIYKGLKREWAIERQKPHDGRVLTREEAGEFLLTPDLERRIKSDAKQALKIFLAQADQENRSRDTFWRDVGAGIVAAFCYSLLLIAVTLILHWSGVDLLELAKRAYPPEAAGK